MPVSELDQLLAEAAAQVLETMFFTSLAEEGEPVAPLSEPLLCTRLEFRGNPPGRLGIRLPVETARQIAGNFLGLEPGEVSETQVGEVICELSNMVCGWVLSRLESESVFELRHPEIGPSETTGAQNASAVRRTLGLEEGVMEVWVELETAP